MPSPHLPIDPNNPNLPGYRWDVSEGQWITEERWQAKQRRTQDHRRMREAAEVREMARYWGIRRRNAIIGLVIWIFISIYFWDGLGELGTYFILSSIALIVYICWRQRNHPYEP